MNILNVLSEVPVLGDLIYRFLDFLDKRDARKQMKKRIDNQFRMVQVSEKSTLAEGVNKIKRAMRNNLDSYKNGSMAGVNLLTHAEGIDHEKARIMNKTSNLKAKDVRTKKEWDNMIQTRIGHYQQLQDDKLKRELVRSLRYESDPEKRKELQAEFKRRNNLR